MSTSQSSALSRAPLEFVESQICEHLGNRFSRPEENPWSRLQNAVMRLALEEPAAITPLLTWGAGTGFSKHSILPTTGPSPTIVVAGKSRRTRRRAALRGQCRADVLLGRLEVKLARRYRASGATSREELAKVLARELWSKSSEVLASLVWMHLGKRITGRSIRRTHKTRGPLSNKWQEWARYRSKNGGPGGAGQETAADDLVSAGLLGRTMREVKHGGGRTKTRGPQSELVEERDADRDTDQFLRSHGVDVSQMPAE